MNIVIMLCGIYMLAFAVFHMLFWGMFNWKKDLAKLHYANKAIMQILNLRLIWFFLLIAYLCFAYPIEMLYSPVGRTVLAGISLFWLGRTIEQFIFFKQRNKFINILTVVFILGTILFAIAFFDVFGSESKGSCWS